MSNSASEQDTTPFLFDDFFADERERVVTVPISIMGRQVPITVKAGLTVEDRLSAQRAAVKKQVKPTGEVIILGIDEGEATMELLVRAIVRWPFTYRNGTAVPVTKENIKQLLGGADAIASVIKKLDEEGVASLAPFVTPSAEA